MALTEPLLASIINAFQPTKQWLTELSDFKDSTMKALIAIGIGLSVLLGSKSLPFWLVIVAFILFGSKKSN